MSQDKVLIAFALANLPAWTNVVSQYDPWGRMANVAGSAALPRVTPLGTNPSPSVPAAGDRGTTKGGPSWDSSVAPR